MNRSVARIIRERAKRKRERERLQQRKPAVHVGLSMQEALEWARRGYRVREASMSEGWTVAFIDAHFYFINPHTGSNHGFTATKWWRESREWEVIS